MILHRQSFGVEPLELVPLPQQAALPLGCYHRTNNININNQLHALGDPKPQQRQLMALTCYNFALFPQWQKFR